jgi:hypothetical protein
MILGEGMDEILKVLRGFRFSLTDEKTLQSEIAIELAKAGLQFKREVLLGPGDIVDFMVGRVAIEVKIKGQKRAIYRQCERYCKHYIAALILATNTPMGMPKQILGKDIWVVNLGKAWL